MDVNIDRIMNHLDEIGRISSGTKGYTRLAYSEEEDAALQWLKTKMEENGIPTKQDRVGNVFGRIGQADAPALLMGSHLDSVFEGGLYDGALGVVLGLECLLRIKEIGINLNNPVELVAFRGEEANVLGGTFGSRAFAGLIEESEAIKEKLEGLSFDWQDVESVRNRKKYLSYMELHIEQGSVLEANEKQIGVVTSIAGIIRFHVTVKGKSSHSGTTPMDMRRDALLYASKIIQEVNQIVCRFGGDNVATVGELDVHPNQANVVPGLVNLTVEIRGSKLNEMKMIEEEIKAYIRKHFEAETRQLIEKAPSELSRDVQNKIIEACKNNFVSFMSIPSGANHDANSLVNNMEVGMVFVPSKDGLSHHPEEFTSVEDIKVGSEIMLEVIANLCTD
ncbi:hypothetical protein M948_05095 [Virgibacillus sp. CM-4]|uniref:Zn-dependent hydrolase n=1 Tax=Virgibacillus sp. CM-4 TaxID=1354277 RepID=UPI00038820ED|nr:Zn-dependent hydrolase [Virgibacillus sp. CM-4]EQB37946.1 hypothetical protein M948_05095 [Virgibacillus sp. CM-4]